MVRMVVDLLVDESNGHSSMFVNTMHLHNESYSVQQFPQILTVESVKVDVVKPMKWPLATADSEPSNEYLWFLGCAVLIDPQIA